MKNSTILVFLLLILCSSEGDSILEPQKEPLTVELVTYNSNINIDEVVTFELKTNRTFNSISHSTDNFTTSRMLSKSQGDSFW